MKRKAFTLVELIVVITILAILGTIAFISIDGYSKDTRDATRLSDVNNMKKSLELYVLEKGKYPFPDKTINVTYSGSEVWTQGIFGSGVLKEILKLSNLPIDPLTNTEYAYSLLNTGKEYQIGGVLEGSLSKLNNQAVSASGEIIATAYVTGNYNGEIAEIEKTGEKCLVAIPSIISASGTTVEEIIATDSFVYKGRKNLPSNYKETKFKLKGEEGLKVVNNDSLELYCGDLNDLGTNETERLNFVENFQKAYSGTQVTRDGNIKKVLEIVIDTENPQPDFKLGSISLIEDVLDTKISEEQKTLANECNIGYHFEGGVCISDTKSCNVSYGIGEQTWDGTDWGICLAISCETGYTGNGLICIANTWYTSTWSTCTVTCGGGTQTRTVICRDYTGNNLLDTNCLATKPIISQACNTQACASRHNVSCSTAIESGGVYGCRVKSNCKYWNNLGVYLGPGVSAYCSAFSLYCGSAQCYY